jgi:hypothetical protein
MTRKQRLRKLTLDTAKDAAGNFAYYGRKEDEELSREDLEEAFSSGAVTIDDVVAAFRKVLEDNFS